MTDKYVPNRQFTDLFPEISGNEVNGLGEMQPRRPSPFFWHPAGRQTHGKLQEAVINFHRRAAEIRAHYSPDADRGPPPVERANQPIEETAADWTKAVKDFTLSNEGDLVGIAAMDPMYVYEGYEIAHKWVIVVGVSMDHDEIDKAPASLDDPAAGVEVARQYNRASRVSRKLRNYILAQGHPAKDWPGPFASALSMMPAAIAAGLGELGKHGSLINDVYGSSFRLSAVTTDMPLLSDAPADFGADDFCTNCKICSSACPPDAIHSTKQWVRGTQKWYVNFDKCIPYFGETLACGICIARCPWSTPGRAPKLAQKMLTRRARRAQP